MKPTAITTAAGYRSQIRRLRLLFWTGVVVSLGGTGLLFATLFLVIGDALPADPLLGQCLLMRFWVAPLGIGLAAAGAVGLIGTRAWQFSLRSVMLSMLVIGVLLGAVTSVRSRSRSNVDLSVFVNDGVLQASCGYWHVGHLTKRTTIALLYYDWNDKLSCHYWAMLPFLILPLVIKWPRRTPRDAKIAYGYLP